jgi:hypothetical protein
MTIKSYTVSVRPLATFLRDHDMPDGIEYATSGLTPGVPGDRAGRAVSVRPAL